MKYQQQQLDNGLTVIAECNPSAYTSAFGFFVKAGSRDESPEIGGVSHFLEHMVFKGTPKRSADQVNLELDEMGSSSNARTGEESTIYHAAVLPEFQESMVELLADLMRPSLREDDFETEKKVIIEEIMMYQDQPPFGGHELIMEKFFGNHPLGQSVLGTVETVGNLTASQMNQYFQSRYSPGNIALAAAGDINFQELVAHAEKYCGHWEPTIAERRETMAEYQTGFEILHKEQSHQQYLLQIAPGPSNQLDERFAMRVAVTVFGDDSGSRMYWKFLDSGLAESAGSGSYEYLDSGLVMSYLCCDPEQADTNLRLLKELQLEFREHGITQKELDLAKQKIASHIVLSSERTENRMFSVGSQWLNGQEFKSPEQIAEIYECLTLEQVNLAIQKYPLDTNMTLAVGPQKNLQPA
ncbi:MAG: pitrilysin family protein [Planctomycetota bacterium]